MTLSLPTEGQLNWDEPLNAALTNLDERVTGAQTDATSAFSRANHTGQQALSTISDAGTAAALDVPASGDAASGEVVKGDDTRLSDARTPASHTHPATQISDSTTAGRALLTAADAPAQRTALALGTAATKDTGTSSGDVALLGTGGRFDIARLASGTPDGTKFVRDDGTLATPAPASSSPWTYQAKTASFTAADGYFYTVDATSGDVTVTAPAASSGARFAVKRIDGSANTVTVDPPGSVTTDGDLTTTLVSRWVTVTFISDGTNWLIESTAREAESDTGTPLASVSYSDASAEAILGSTTSATHAEANTNLRLPSFTVPASGTVLVRCNVVGNPNGSAHRVSVWDYTAGAAVSGTVKLGSAVSGQQVYTHEWRITGLTPGASATFSLGHARSSGAPTCFLYSGTTAGAAVMSVWSA